MGSPLQEFPLAPRLRPVGILDEGDDPAGVADRADHRILGRHQPLGARQHHGAALGAEIVHHVHDEDRGVRRRQDHAVVIVPVGGEGIHRGLPAAAGQEGDQAPAASSSSILSRMTNFCGLPVTVIGNASTKWT